MWSTKHRRSLGLLAVTIVAGLVVAELALRLFAPYHDPLKQYRDVDLHNYIPRQHEPGYEFVSRPEAGLLGVAGTNRFVINAYGVRGELPADPMTLGLRKVVLLGGSTMEASVLDETKAPHARLQEALTSSVGDNWWILNAGRSGDTTPDHLAVLSQRLVHLEPEVVVVRAGVNDLRAAAEGRDFRYLQPLGPVRFGAKRSALLMATSTQIGRRLYGLTRPVLSATQQNIFLGEVMPTSYRWAAGQCARQAELTDELRTDLAPYERNLRSIVGVARANGARPILVTHPSSWTTRDRELERWHWMLCAGGRRYSADAWKSGLRSYNEATRRVGREMAVAVVDAARDLPPSSAAFYDDVHLNEAGAAALAHWLIPAILGP